MAMKLKDKILFNLITEIRKLGTEIIIPNYYVGSWEMDLFRLLDTGYLHEYEIKTSRADFKNDFKKSTHDVIYHRDKPFSECLEKTNFRKKHEELESGKYVANKFFFVVPENLVSAEECPNYAGLIYYVEDEYGRVFFKQEKPAKFIHKNKYDVDYKSICKSLSYRGFGQTLKVRNLTAQNKELKNNRKKIEKS